jgi:hypothetical protein
MDDGQKVKRTNYEYEASSVLTYVQDHPAQAQSCGRLRVCDAISSVIVKTTQQVASSSASRVSPDLALTLHAVVLPRQQAAINFAFRRASSFSTSLTTATPYSSSAEYEAAFSSP